MLSIAYLLHNQVMWLNLSTSRITVDENIDFWFGCSWKLNVIFGASFVFSWKCITLFWSVFRGVVIVIIMAHSFPWKILPNSAGLLAKFRCLPQENCPNSTAYLGFLFMSKLSSVLFKNFSCWITGIVVCYASNVQRQLSVFFFLKLQSVRLHSVCFIWFCHVAIAISRAHSFRQFSLNFSVTFRDKIASSD